MTKQSSGNEAFLFLFLAFIIFVLLITSSCAGPADVKVKDKKGDSCSVDGKCKMLVVRWEGGTMQGAGGHVYYRCVVDKSFYEITEIGESVQLDLEKCEKINP